jgi:hypothetical protein
MKINNKKKKKKPIYFWSFGLGPFSKLEKAQSNE